MVTVGDARNPADTETGFGAVGYEYAIGQYEITVDQYVTFLNAVAAAPNDPAIADLWQESMKETKDYVSVEGLIAGTGTPNDPYVYSTVPDANWGQDAGRRAILEISWFAAARFANWLHNGATAGADTETGAYTLNYATTGVFTKNAGARWWIPSDDEWYKAAFYDPTKPDANHYWQYPTRSDALPAAEAPPGGSNSANYDSRLNEGMKITPVGAYSASASYYGTYDQAGLAWEWTDAQYLDHDGQPVTRGLRGGSWSLGLINISKLGPRDYTPEYKDDDTGFRLATHAQ